MVYHALYNIYRELYNPYGPRRVDIPHEVAVGAIRKLFAQLTDVGEASLPPSLVDDCRKRDGMFFAKVLKRNSVALRELAAQSSRRSEARSPQRGSVLDQADRDGQVEEKADGVRPVEPIRVESDVQQALIAGVSVGTGVADSDTELLAALGS